MARRIEARIGEPVVELGQGLHPVLARVLGNRALKDAAELETGLEHLLPADALMGMEAALDLLQSALREGETILIVGDYDADGATSTALCVRALRLMGAERVEYLVPNRFEYGYGLSPEIVEVAQQGQPQPRLIITVDNGISSIEGVATAQRYGMRVLITDHHLAGEGLPPAEAIVNPNQPGDTFASKALAGVGVIFYVMLALRRRLRETGWFGERDLKEPNLAQLLDLVALGTVADVVPLDRNNRILVAQGLARIRRGQCAPGITALCRVAGRDQSTLVSADLGFALAPRLNAAGRMDDMSVGIECLLTDSEERARELAVQLDALNLERRQVEAQMRQEAMQAVDQLELDEAELPYGLCLFDEGWHQGVIGILASRIKERLHRPVIAFADAGDGELKGSARSIPGLHIRDALDSVAARHPHLLRRFGGHAMAAGLSLARQDYPEFVRAFEQVVRERLSESDLEGVVLTDGTLGRDEITMQLTEQLRYFLPWGQGFPEPAFHGEFVLVSRRIVGGNHLKLQLRYADSDRVFDAIAFNVTDAEWQTGVERVRLVYRLSINDYAGRRSVQLMVDQIEPLEEG
jgi:single-stranded-DNA-specific exonuclease